MTYEMTLLEREMLGRAEGHAEGLTEGVENVALNLIAMSLPFEKIQQATNLSISRIKDLAAENSIALKVE